MEGQQEYLTGSVELMQSSSLTETLLLPRSSSDDQQLLSVRAVSLGGASCSNTGPPPEEGTHSQDAMSEFGPSSDTLLLIRAQADCRKT